MEFSPELRNDVLAGEITLSVRLWKRPRVKPGGRYRVGFGEIEVDTVELVRFAAITVADVRVLESRTARHCGSVPRTQDLSAKTPPCTASNFTWSIQGTEPDARCCRRFGLLTNRGVSRLFRGAFGRLGRGLRTSPNVPLGVHAGPSLDRRTGRHEGLRGQPAL